MTDPRETPERQEDRLPRTETDCEHLHLVAYGAPGGGWGLWACSDCKLRFYPACRTCVDIGHRNVVHPEAALEVTESPDGLDGHSWDCVCLDGSVCEYFIPEDDAWTLDGPVRALVTASRDESGQCRFCLTPRSTMHDPDCPVEAVIRHFEPGYRAALAPATEGAKT